MDWRPRAVVLDLLTDCSDVTRQQLIDRVSSNTYPTVDVIVLCRQSTDITSLCPQTTTQIVSNDIIDAMFKAKCHMDDAAVTCVAIVTSLVMKKFWEMLCFHLLSHLHTWCVVAVDVSGQSTSVFAPDLTKVETSIKCYLQSLKGYGNVEIIRSDVIPSNQFNAGFHTRQGGISTVKTLASMNVLYTMRKPDPTIVISENLRRLADAADFDLNHWHIARSEHGNTVWVVDREEPPPARYDGVVTNMPGVTVAAPGADCCVILLADCKTGACGAVHAGWRGTVSRAIKQTLLAMVDNFGTEPCHVRAAIGPSLEGTCFDLPASDAKPISDLDPSLTWPSSRDEGWVCVDLARANAAILQREGVAVENIDLNTSQCTACCNDKFFSHRRDGIPFGNQIGFISCRKSE